MFNDDCLIGVNLSSSANHERYSDVSSFMTCVGCRALLLHICIYLCVYVCVYVVTPGPLSTTDATPIAKLLFSSVTPCVVLLNGPGGVGKGKAADNFIDF